MGCKDKESWQEPAPEEVFRGFLMDWFRGERESAFDTIVASDREALMAPLKELQKTHDAESLPEAYQMLVVGRVNNPYDFKSIEPSERLSAAPEPGQRLELTLNFHDGHTGSATMVWSGERWLVALPLGDAEVPEQGAPRDDSGASNSGADTFEDASDAGSMDAAPDASPVEPLNPNLPPTPSKTP